MANLEKKAVKGKYCIYDYEIQLIRVDLDSLKNIIKCFCIYEIQSKCLERINEIEKELKSIEGTEEIE